MNTVEEELNKSEYCFFQTVGDSMEPLLHDRRSTVVITKTGKTVRKYDVVLFRRPTGEYVLHRVWKVRKKDYLFCGDNRIYKEPVPADWILGIMVGFYPDESKKFLTCRDKEYQEYMRGLYYRYCIRWIKRFPGRLFKKLVG